MQKVTCWGYCIALIVGLMFGAASNANADACWDHWRAKLEAQNVTTRGFIAQLKATGDCAYLEKLVASSNRYDAVLRATPCDNMNKRFAPPGETRARYARYCKPRSTQQEIAKKNEEIESSRSEAQTPLSSPKDGARRSASCSDITGTNSKASAARNCNQAKSALNTARAAQKKNPGRATEQYKKAADAYRRAGDTAQADAILREATGQASVVATAPSVSSQAPSANSPPAAPNRAAAMPSQPAVGGVPRIWDGSRDTCPTANNLEKNTASWYVMCDPDSAKKPASDYRPYPDPLELSKQARQACGSYSRDTQQCFADFKLKAILARNPGMRETCEKAAEQSPLRREMSERLGFRGDNNQGKFLECVDNAYLYGNPDGPPRPKNALRDNLRKSLNATKPDDSKRTTETASKPNLCWSPGRCCAPGHGLKQTPGAFGASSCQPLGLLALNTTQPRLASKDEAELIEDFEERVNDNVAKAVAAVLAAFGSAMSESDRDMCAAASFAAVHAMLKGGAPNVPEQCRAMASGTRAYFAAYADGHVNNSSNAMEDLLASFRIDLGAPIPGLIGLTPDEQARRSGECLLRGGSVESCN